MLLIPSRRSLLSSSSSLCRVVVDSDPVPARPAQRRLPTSATARVGGGTAGRLARQRLNELPGDSPSSSSSSSYCLTSCSWCPPFFVIFFSSFSSSPATRRRSPSARPPSAARRPPAAASYPGLGHQQGSATGLPEAPEGMLNTRSILAMISPPPDPGARTGPNLLRGPAQGPSWLSTTTNGACVARTTDETVVPSEILGTNPWFPWDYSRVTLRCRR